MSREDRAAQTAERVTLVDRQGNRTGVAGKLQAHENGGLLHLAFSILIVNARGELLLQRRADCKYHFAGLWSNSCCGHPRPDEAVPDAARRRLREEFGFDAALRQGFTLLYEAHDAQSNLTERELLHVLYGSYDGTPLPDPAEIGAWCWRPWSALGADVAAAPQAYTPWFRLLLGTLLDGRGAGAPPALFASLNDVRGP